MSHPHARDTIALAAICLSALMFGLEISSVPAVLPVVDAALGGSFTDLQWIVNAYTLASTTVLMATGTLADRFGRRRVLAVAVATFGLTSLLCALAPSVGVLIAGRFLQGISGGAMLICQIAILSHQFPDGRPRARAFGTWGIVFGAGLGFGPIVGAALVAAADWRWVFGVHVIVAGVTLAMVFRGVRESRDPRAAALDVAGVVTLTPAVFGLVLYIVQGGVWGFGSPPALAILAATLAFAALFVAVERRSAHPMVDFAVFRNRRFSGALLGSLGMNFSFWALIIYLPLYLQNGLGYDVTAAGATLLAYTVPTLLLPPLAERLALRHGPEVIITVGLYLIGAGFVALWFGSSVPDASWLTILPGSLLAGAGVGLANTPVTNTTTGSVPAERAGMASGIDMSARMIALSVNVAVMGLILTAGVAAHLRDRLGLSPEQARDLAREVTDGGGERAGDAMAAGFGLIALYGAGAVGILATAGLLLFRSAGRPVGDPTRTP